MLLQNNNSGPLSLYHDCILFSLLKSAECGLSLSSIVDEETNRARMGSGDSVLCSVDDRDAGDPSVPRVSRFR